MNAERGGLSFGPSSKGMEERLQVTNFEKVDNAVMKKGMDEIEKRKFPALLKRVSKENGNKKLAVQSLVKKNSNINGNQKFSARSLAKKDLCAKGKKKFSALSRVKNNSSEPGNKRLPVLSLTKKMPPKQKGKLVHSFQKIAKARQLLLEISSHKKKVYCRHGNMKMLAHSIFRRVPRGTKAAANPESLDGGVGQCHIGLSAKDNLGSGQCHIGLSAKDNLGSGQCHIGLSAKDNLGSGQCHIGLSAKDNLGSGQCDIGLSSKDNLGSGQCDIGLSAKDNLGSGESSTGSSGRDNPNSGQNYMGLSGCEDTETKRTKLVSSGQDNLGSELNSLKLESVAISSQDSTKLENSVISNQNSSTVESGGISSQRSFQTDNDEISCQNSSELDSVTELSSLRNMGEKEEIGVIYSQNILSVDNDVGSSQKALNLDSGAISSQESSEVDSGVRSCQKDSKSNDGGIYSCNSSGVDSVNVSNQNNPEVESDLTCNQNSSMTHKCTKNSVEHSGVVEACSNKVHSSGRPDFIGVLSQEFTVRDPCGCGVVIFSSDLPLHTERVSGRQNPSPVLRLVSEHPGEPPVQGGEGYEQTPQVCLSHAQESSSVSVSILSPPLIRSLPGSGTCQTPAEPVPQHAENCRSDRESAHASSGGIATTDSNSAAFFGNSEIISCQSSLHMYKLAAEMNMNVSPQVSERSGESNLLGFSHDIVTPQSMTSEGPAKQSGLSLSHSPEILQQESVCHTHAKPSHLPAESHVIGCEGMTGLREAHAGISGESGLTDAEPGPKGAGGQSSAKRCEGMTGLREAPAGTSGESALSNAEPGPKGAGGQSSAKRREKSLLQQPYTKQRRLYQCRGCDYTAQLLIDMKKHVIVHIGKYKGYNSGSDT